MNNIIVSAAIIKKENTILITRRLGGDFDGLWEFPGGKIEKGETGEMAVIREIKEELDLVVGPTSFLTTVEYQYPKFHLTMHTYWCEIVSGNLTLNDHSDFRWVTKSQLNDVEWVPADIDVVTAIINSKTL